MIDFLQTHSFIFYFAIVPTNFMDFIDVNIIKLVFIIFALHHLWYYCYLYEIFYLI